MSDNLSRKLKDAQIKEEEARKERQRIETEVIARKFFKDGWNKRGEYEDEKKASEAATVLSEHKKKYHSKKE